MKSIQPVQEKHEKKPSISINSFRVTFAFSQQEFFLRILHIIDVLTGPAT